MTEKRILKKTLDFGKEIITRIKSAQEKSEQEYFQRVFYTPPEPNEPNTRRRSQTMLYGVMFYSEQWSPIDNRWVETGRDYWPMGPR